MIQMDSATFCDNRAHGGDEIALESINGFVCAVVADGVSGSDCGHTASNFAVQSVLKAFRSHYRNQDWQNFGDFVESLCHCLEGDLPNRPLGSARTTLTAVVIEPGEAMTDGRRWVTAHYVALGDSPIIICRRQWSPADPTGLDFLCHPIHDRPLVIDDASRIYSYYDATAQRIRGTPAIGSFRLYEGDVCLVATDGIPTIEHIARDVFGDRKFGFLNTVKQDGAVAGVAWLKDIVDQEPLQDDGAMVVIHFRDQGEVFSKQRLLPFHESRPARVDERALCLPAFEATEVPAESAVGCRKESQISFQQDWSQLPIYQKR